MSNHSLNEARRDAADSALANYQGTGEERLAIVDFGEWKTEKDLWTIDVYFEQEDAETVQSFKVKFSPNSAEVVQADY